MHGTNGAKPYPINPVIRILVGVTNGPLSVSQAGVCQVEVVFSMGCDDKMKSCLLVVLRGTIVNRTCGIHKNLCIRLFLRTIFGPINYGPP